MPKLPILCPPKLSLENLQRLPVDDRQPHLAQTGLRVFLKIMLRSSSRKMRAARSRGKPKIPVEIGGMRQRSQPQPVGQRQAAADRGSQFSVFVPRSPHRPHRVDHVAARQPPRPGISRLSVGHRPMRSAPRRHSPPGCSRPPRLTIAPATPPPCARWLLAAFTMASTCSSVRSPLTSSRRCPEGYDIVRMTVFIRPL